MNKRGFTLVELMISAAILAVITAGLWRMTKGGMLFFLRAQRQAGAINSGELAMRGSGPHRGILRDIRRCSAAAAVLPDRLNLICPDGARAYFRQGNELLQLVAGSTTTAAKNITALGFSYYKIQDGLLSLTAVPSLVDSIEVGLTAANGDVEYKLVSSARLRNK